MFFCVGVETDAVGGWTILARRLEAPKGASAFPGGTDKGVVDVNADDVACSPRVCWLDGQRVTAWSSNGGTYFAGDPTLVAADVENVLSDEKGGRQEGEPWVSKRRAFCVVPIPVLWNERCKKRGVGAYPW